MMRNAAKRLEGPPMNVFATSSDPLLAAQALDDKRVIKQTLETGQILSSALHNLGYWRANLYRPTHLRHPVVLWAGESRGNFNWLVLHGLALGKEYKDRFGASDHKTSTFGASSRCDHRSTSVILFCAEAFKDCRLDAVGMTPWKNCTDVIGNISTEKKYQVYLYSKWKTSTPKWTRRGPPEWYKEEKVNGQ